MRVARWARSEVPHQLLAGITGRRSSSTPSPASPSIWPSLQEALCTHSSSKTLQSDPYMAASPSPCGSPVDKVIQGFCEKGELDKALEFLEQLSFPPSHHTLISLLQTCRKFRSLVHTNRFYAFLVLHRIQPHGPLGDHLVSALAKCGNLETACLILEDLPFRTVHSWTAVITSLVEHGYPREALAMHKRMINDGVKPTHHTFAVLFKACGNILDLEEGRRLHEDARIEAFTSRIYVGNALVGMYRKCGSIREAETVFAALPQHDVVSWNSMLAAYIDQGEGAKAICLFRQMYEEGKHPNEQTFVMALQVCGLLAEAEQDNLDWKVNRMKFLSIIQALHAEVKRNGFACNVFVGTTLVTMYGKCGTIVEAEYVSSGMPDHDIVSWTAMLSAYAHQGEGRKALMLYRKMLGEGMNPDPKAFAIAFQACDALTEEEKCRLPDSSNMAVPLQIAQALHADAAKKGFASDTVLGCMLVNTYSKCGSIKATEDTFCELPQRDTSTWTAMISAYVDHGDGGKALRLYRQLREEGVKPDHLTIATTLRACNLLAQKEEGVNEWAPLRKVHARGIVQALHAEAKRGGFVSDPFVTNMLISAYGGCGAIGEAEKVFSAVERHDQMVWLKMLSAYLEQGLGERSLHAFKLMQETGTGPNVHTFLIAVQACGVLAQEEETIVSGSGLIRDMIRELGQALLADSQKGGFMSELYIATALVNLLGKCGRIEDVESVCAELPQPDVVLWTALLSAYIEQGYGEKALELYRCLQISCSLNLDDVTVVCVLQACGRTGSLEICQHLHFAMISSSNSISCFLASVLAYAYGSCASIRDVHAIFDHLLDIDIVTWNACIAGYAGEGNLSASVRMAQEMQVMGFTPDGVTFISLLSACSHVGLVCRGLELMDCLIRDFRLPLDLKHYSTLLDLLGRAGQFKKVETLLKRMRVQADLPTWVCLLGACRIHGHVGLAKQAFHHAVALQPKETAPYILMAQIYCDAGLQDLAAEVDRLRGCKGVALAELD